MVNALALQCRQTFSCDGVHKDDCQQIWERTTLSGQLTDERGQQAFFSQWSDVFVTLENHRKSVSR